MDEQDFNLDFPSKPTGTGTPDRPGNFGGTMSGLPVYHPVGPAGSGGGAGGGGTPMSLDEMFDALPKNEHTFNSVQGSVLPKTGGRYDRVFPGRDYEEMHGQGQATWEKWMNSGIKTLGTASSAFVGGTVGLVYGAGKMVFETGKFSSLYDNEVNRRFDEINQQMENDYANYTTHAEQDANWYSSDNILSANFWADKVMKNIGFSLGSMAAGFGWGMVFKAIGQANAMIRAGKALEALQGIDKAIEGTSRLGRFGAVSEYLNGTVGKTMQTLGKSGSFAERGLISTMGAMGEASIEALGNANAYRDKMIEQHLSTYGRMPSTEEMTEYNKYAEKMGNYTFGMNVALLTVSNYMMLPKIFNSSKSAERRMMNEVAKDAGKETIEEGGKKFVKGAKGVIADTEAAYVSKGTGLSTLAGEKGVGKAVGMFDKYIWKPGSLLFSRNEAIEEGAQYTVQKGTEDYFNRARENGEDISDFWSTLAGVLGDGMPAGVKETLNSKEGMESILIGGISGGMQGSFSPFGDSKVRERGVFGTGGYRAKNTSIAIKELSEGNLTKSLRDFVKYTNIGINSQTKRQEAIEANDKLAEKDYERDYVQSYLMPRIKYGKLDIVKNEIDLYRQLAATDKGFNELKGEGIVLEKETMPQFMERLDSIQNSAEALNQVYETVDDKYSTMLNKDKTVKYTDDVIDKMVYASGKILDYDSRLKGVNAKLLAKNVNTAELEKAIRESEGFKEGLPSKIIEDENVKDQMLRAILKIEDNVAIEDDEVKRDLVDFAEMLVRRQNFVNEYNDIKERPELYKEVYQPPAMPFQAGGTGGEPEGPEVWVDIPTKRGDRKIKIGESYVLGRNTNYDEKGNEVYSAPRVQIVAQNEDGSFQVKDIETGKVSVMSKEDFANYNVTTLSEVEKNPVAMYILDHWNVVYKHMTLSKKLGRDVTGRLVHGTKKDGSSIALFEYLDGKGIKRTIQVTGDMLVSKDPKKFKHGILKPLGTLTAKQQLSEQTFQKATKESFELNLQERGQIIFDLFNSVIERQDKAKALVASKKTQLENSKAELEKMTQEIEENKKVDKRYKKEVRFDKATTFAMKEADKVANSINQLEKEIAEQEYLVEQLESNLEYISEYANDLENQPADFSKFVAKIRQERILINKSIEETKKNISALNKVLRKAKNLFDEIGDFIDDLFNGFKKKNPDFPLFEGIVPIKEGEYRLSPEFKEKFRPFVEGVDATVPISESSIKGFEDALEANILALDMLEKQLSAHDQIYDAFKKELDRKREAEEEEVFLANSAKIRNQLLGTNSVDPQATTNSKEYNPSPTKDWINMLSGTVSPSGMKFDSKTGKWEPSGEPIPEHFLRSNRFGARIGKIIDPDSVFGYVVNIDTAELIFGTSGKEGGLMEHLKGGDTSVDETQTLALVMGTKDSEGKFVLVDEKGDPIPANLSNKEKMSLAIYQPFPSEGFPATSFREGTTDEQKKVLNAKYKLWRDSELIKKQLDPLPQKVSASFGTPRYVTYRNDKNELKRDYNARNTVVETELVTDDQILNEKVIHVQTTNDLYKRGTTSFSKAMGRVFLDAGTHAVKLINRTFTKNEAEVMYDAIYQLSKNIAKNGTAKTAESQQIIKWLKSVVYWGMPKTPEKVRKPAGYNSIWFEQVADAYGTPSLRLFFSGKGTNIVFSPKNIADSKEAIIAVLRTMYGNTDANMLKSVKKPYKQLVGFSKEGKPEFVTWPNYQSFLLSPKKPGLKGKELTEHRSTDDIPLVTNMAPITEAEPINREGIYFIREKAFDLTDVPVKKEAKKEAKETKGKQQGPQQQGPAAGAAAGNASTVNTSVKQGDYKLDGSKNVVEINRKKNPTAPALRANFTLNANDAIAVISKNPQAMTSRGEFIKALVNTDVVKVSYDEGQLYPFVEDTGFNAITNMKDIEHFTRVQVLARVFPQFEVAAARAAGAPTVNPPVSTQQQPPITEEAFFGSFSSSADFSQGGFTGFTGPGEIVGGAVEPAKGTIFNMMFGDGANTEGNVSDTGQPLGDPVGTVGEPVGTVTPITSTNEVDNAILNDFFNDVNGELPKDKGGIAEARAVPVGEEGHMDYQKEDWGKTEQWLKDKFKNVPVYRVKNVIRSTNGKQVWGYFQNGAIYVYESAEVGTTYHEVFEAVWKAFAGPKEKNRIIKEFRDRPGTFVFPFTKKEIEYSKATDDQIKEMLAEEFRERVLHGEQPLVYNKRSLIKKLFDDLINFIKTFFLGKESAYNTEQLFNKIGGGYYNDFNPFEYKLSLADTGIRDIPNANPGPIAEYRYRINNIPEAIVQDLIHHMTYLTMNKMVSEDTNVFDVEGEKASDLYNRLKADILGERDTEGKLITKGILREKADKILLDYNDGKGAISKEKMQADLNKAGELFLNVTKEWDEIVKRHMFYLRTYQLTFDENDELVLNKEEQSNKAFEPDARTVDVVKKTDPSLRLLLSSLPLKENVMKKGTNTKGEPVEIPGVQIKETAINGYKLKPFDEVFNELMRTLHDSENQAQMINRISDMALKNPTYTTLYRALTQNSAENKVSELDIDGYDKTTLDLLAEMWKTFKKQNSEVIGVYIFPGGDIFIGDASLTSAARQVKREQFNNVVHAIKNNNIYISYNYDKKIYNATETLRKYKFNPNDFGTYYRFLKNIGIDFPQAEYNQLNEHNQQPAFRAAVEGIRESLLNVKNFHSVTTKSLDLEGRLMGLATLKVINSDVAYASTYYSLTGEKSQSYIGVNALSNLFDVISKKKNISELADTDYAYLLTDEFIKDPVTEQFSSVLLGRMFDLNPESKDFGKRIKGTEDLFSSVQADGTIDLDGGDTKESSRLSYMQRLIQEINLNLNGYYLNLVPGDASIEWATKMYPKDSPLVSEEESDNDEYINIFANYFMSEVTISRSDRDIFTGRDNRDLRFFKDILPEDLHDRIKASPEGMTAQEIYDEYEDEINEAVIEFVEGESKSLKEELIRYKQIKEDEEGEQYVAPKLDLGKKRAYSMEEIESKLKNVTVNYIIANTEYHKVLYSDPFMYKDELKRIKNFNSPRQALMVLDDKMARAYSNEYNKGFEDTVNEDGTITPNPNRTDFDRKHMNTLTIEDPFSNNSHLEYDPFEDTDGGGIITDKANRLMRILASDWNKDCERQYRHDAEYERLVRGGASKADVDAHEKNNPGISEAYTARKPIVSGSKLSERGYNDIVMDKYALVPYSFRILHKLNPNSNALKLYNKMKAEDIDYAVYASGRKVGTELTTKLYDENGKFNNAPFNTQEQIDNPMAPQSVIKIPYNIMAIQAEVPTKTVAKTTEGSQLTQLATLDFNEAGVPIDFMTTRTKGKEGDAHTYEAGEFDRRFEAWEALSEDQKKQQSPLYREQVYNKELLDTKIALGYEDLLVKTGVRETATGYEISDRDRLIDTITHEILRREVNENIIEAFEEVKSGDVVAEATPAFKQIRAILYSIANKNITTRKTTGKMAVQISERLLEEGDVKVDVVQTKKGPVTVYNSDNLAFYERTGENGETIKVCQVMVGRWFDSTLSDEELLKFLNTTDEGKRILEGIGFRIPTQKQNSIDAFEIKQFLPAEFGDNVVIPAALVKKVGSDFDIDKLSMYFKNVKVNKEGYPQIVKLSTEDTVEARAKRYIAYVNSHAVSEKDFIAKIKEETGATELKEEIKQFKNDLDFERTELDIYSSDASRAYIRGYQLFKSLPDNLRQYFYNQNESFTQEDHKGMEVTIQRRILANSLIENLSKKGNEKNAKSIKILEGMISNYDEYLLSKGMIEDSIDKIKNLTVGLTTTGSYLNNEVRLELAKLIAKDSQLDSFQEFAERPMLMQNSIEAVDNEYHQSLFNLVSSPYNFERLTVPNSAKRLTDLNDKLSRLLGRQKTDYSSPGNMLRRGYMSRLRHAFVTGKRAIGIAATSQTNHANNQKAPMVIFTEKLAGNQISDKDKAFLKNANITFQKDRYNSILYEGKQRPTLSMIKNAAGEFISDFIGMFIDGYVDISKGAWIMELGATPNTAGTWLFLIKLGVPIEDIAWFMNQPIIHEYLESIETDGYTYLFMDQYRDETMANFEPNVKLDYSYENLKEIPTADVLEQTVGKTYGELDPNQLVHQQFYLQEFLKYAKMAEHLFLVQQGSNYNTANLNDPMLMLQKEFQLDRAKDTIFNTVDNILNKTHIGATKKYMEKSRDVFAEILISDKTRKPGKPMSTREVLEKVMKPYMLEPTRDYLKIAHKAVIDMFDWAVMTADGETRMAQIRKYLVGDKDVSSIVEEIMKYKQMVAENPNHPLKDNLLMKDLMLVPGSREGKVDALTIRNRENKVYNENIIIASFRELREHLASEGSDLYDKIVATTLLQSGLTNSPIAFTHLLPFEDMIKNYNRVLSSLEDNDTLSKFVDLKVFERVNWANTDIVPFKLAKPKKNKNGKLTNQELDFRDGKLMDAYHQGKIPMIININELSKEGNYDVITYSWTNQAYDATTRGIMRRIGNYSYMSKGLFQKVYTVKDGVRVPLIQYGKPDKNGKVYKKYVYKAINAWGDSFKAREMYDTDQASVLDNDYMKVAAIYDPVTRVQTSSPEVSDNVIAAILNPNSTPLAVPEESEVAETAPIRQIMPGGKKEMRTPEEAEELWNEWNMKHVSAPGFTMTLDEFKEQDKETQDKIIDCWGIPF